MRQNLLYFPLLFLAIILCSAKPSFTPQIASVTKESKLAPIVITQDVTANFFYNGCQYTIEHTVAYVIDDQTESFWVYI